MSFGGFSFGAKTTATSGTTAAPGGFTFSTPATSSTAPAGGFSFSTPAAATTAATGLGFAKPLAASTPAPGFGLGGTMTSTTTSASTGFALPVNPGSTATGVSFALPTTSTMKTSAPSGFTLGPAAPASTGTSIFAKPAATSGISSFSLAPAQPAATSSGGFSLTGGLKLGASTAATTSSSLFGGISGLGAASSTAGGSIFGTSVAKTTSTGLGGVDPKTTTSATANDPSKPGDGKSAKETMVENNIMLDVDELRKFVKEEKGEMEQMKRLSSTPMGKVQEDCAALRQLLSLVSSGLQRNVCNVEKLKREMTGELKHAEMAVRTKETPPGLQYENTAPMLYFQCVIESFESQMLQYRQQIEMLENHLASLHQPSRLTHDELILLLRRLHEAFVAMAAQLQQIHEAVKTQKEHYLNYRKVFHGDAKNIFERQKKAPVRVSAPAHMDIYGQSPFPGVNNAAAVAMATALTRTQQPQPQAGAPPVTGFSNFGTTSGFGTGNPPSFGLGTSTTQQSGFKGFGTGGGLFGSGTTSTLGSTQAGSLFTSPLPSTLPAPSLGGDTSFQLNRPPAGAKRGKR
ncbi:nucleoporin p58/p45-like isoform X2 [Mya arenaria]|uniref:nucleoporin p58/p45-like isoform X2 n=1 Tax=Mya arenaria TaxID=6604 RepID=UPI0022E5977F|nr:nucleoporin p58/p45-like isoform X2 [Mya arenaria]